MKIRTVRAACCFLVTTAVAHFFPSSLFATPNVVVSIDDGEYAIFQKYISLGGVNSFLGNATSDYFTPRDGVGHGQNFVGGSIYWSPGTGAHEVHGAILGRWDELSRTDFLGYPATDETPITTGYGRFVQELGRMNNFQLGVISWSPRTGAHEVYGSILGYWQTQGRETGWLGFPLTGEADLPGYPGDRWSKFQNGYIYWVRSTGIANSSRTPRSPSNPPQGGRPGGGLGATWPHGNGQPLVLPYYVTPVAWANYSAEITAALDAWRSSGTLVYFSEVTVLPRYSFSGVYIDIEQVDPTEAGVTRHLPAEDVGPYTRANVFLNKNALDHMNSFDRQKAIVHELGHAIGLAHADGLTSGPSIMKQGQQPYNTPQPFDVLVVNLLYPF